MTVVNLRDVKTRPIRCWQGDKGTIVLSPRMTLADYPNERFAVGEVTIDDPVLATAVRRLQDEQSELSSLWDLATEYCDCGAVKDAENEVRA